MIHQEQPPIFSLLYRTPCRSTPSRPTDHQSSPSHVPKRFYCTPSFHPSVFKVQFCLFLIGRVREMICNGQVYIGFRNCEKIEVTLILWCYIRKVQQFLPYCFSYKKNAGHCVMNNFCEIIKSSIEGKFHKQEIEYPNWMLISFRCILINVI